MKIFKPGDKIKVIKADYLDQHVGIDLNDTGIVISQNNAITYVKLDKANRHYRFFTYQLELV